MTLNSLARRASSAYASGTVSCAIAHNLGSPLDAVNIDVFQEASKTGGVFTVLVIALLVMQGQRVEQEAPTQ